MSSGNSQSEINPQNNTDFAGTPVKHLRLCKSARATRKFLLKLKYIQVSGKEFIFKLF